MRQEVSFLSLKLCLDYVTSHKSIFQLFSFTQTQNSDIFSVNVESLWWWAFSSVLEERLWVWLNPGGAFLLGSVLEGRVFKARRWSNSCFWLFRCLWIQPTRPLSWSLCSGRFVSHELCWRGHGAAELLRIWVCGKSWLESRAGVGCVKGVKLKFGGHISCCSLWLMENCCLMETALSFSSLSLC